MSKAHFTNPRRIGAILATTIGLAVLPGSVVQAAAPTPNPLPQSPIPQLSPLPGVDISGAGPASGIHGDAHAGEAKFAVSCASCHGERGASGITNPGSSDGTVPVLNPIDPGFVDDSNGDASIFAHDLDAFLQHGSQPAGDSPFVSMPAFGDHNMLSQADIADIEAFVMQLNGTFWPDRCPGLRLELGNPIAGSRVEPGSYVAQGRATDVRRGQGVDRVDFFLDERDKGGRFVGSAGGGPSAVAGNFQVTLSLPKLIGGHDLFAYARSAVTGQEAVVSVPIALGRDPAKAFMPSVAVPPSQPATCVP